MEFSVFDVIVHVYSTLAMLKNYLRFLALGNFLYQETTLTLASITAFGQFLKMVITPSMLGQKKRMGTFLKV